MISGTFYMAGKPRQSNDLVAAGSMYNGEQSSYNEGR